MSPLDSRVREVVFSATSHGIVVIFIIHFFICFMNLSLFIPRAIRQINCNLFHQRQQASMKRRPICGRIYGTGIQKTAMVMIVAVKSLKITFLYLNFAVIIFEYVFCRLFFVKILLRTKPLQVTWPSVVLTSVPLVFPRCSARQT